jgi:hypothetical protein
MSRDGRFDNLLGGQASFPEPLGNLDERAGDQFSHRVLLECRRDYCSFRCSSNSDQTSNSASV